MAGSLSRHEQTRCYRLGWAFERCGWVAMVAVIGGAVGGIFGNGLLSSTEVTAGDVLTVHYARFARAEAPFELMLDWAPEQADSVLWIARAYLDQFEIEELRPPPAATTFDRERIYYRFRASRPNERIQVAVRLRAKRGGQLIGSLGVDAVSVELRQLVFP